jgi:hypothetical protein
MGVLASITIIAARPLCCSPASGAVVEMIANIVPIELRASPSELGTGSGCATTSAAADCGSRTGASTAPSSRSSASAAGLSTPLPLAVVVIRVLTPAGPVGERRPLLYGLIPALLRFSICEGRFPADCPAGVFPQDAVHVIGHHPATKKNFITDSKSLIKSLATGCRTFNTAYKFQLVNQTKYLNVCFAFTTLTLINFPSMAGSLELKTSSLSTPPTALAC